MANASDITTESLAKLNNPAEFVRYQGVPIFRSHERTSQDGKTKIKVNDRDLDTIARNTAALEDSHGVPLRVTDGHIKPGADEQEQPRLLGYAKNVRVGTFGPEGARAVLADVYIRREMLPVAKDRPFRSAEYYATSKVIRGLGLLIRDPQLDLGIVTYQQTEPAYHYSLESNMEPQEQQIPNKVEKPKDDFSPEEIEQYERMCRYMSSKGLIKYQSAPAIPSATNALPGQEEKPMPPKNDDDKPEPFSKRESPTLYRKELNETKAELAKLKAEREREKCERILDQLEKVECYSLDREEELAAMIGRDEAGRQKRADYIRAHYQQHPGAAEQINVYAGPANQDGFLTEDQAERATQYMRDEECDWAEAEKHVRSGKK